uniref:Uncharacterized protein n=1 Tax=Glossina austeni TaxID=7395 RepID=A0A1A9V7T1_GLOAU
MSEVLAYDNTSLERAMCFRVERPKLRILCLMLALSVANLMTKPIHSLLSVMRTKRNKKLGCELCDDFVTTTKYNASETAKYNSSWNSLLLHYMDAQHNTTQHKHISAQYI